MTNSRWNNRLPLLMTLGMYLFSCYIGVVLLVSSEDFWAWTNYFSGPQLLPLDPRSFRTLMILLHGGPLFLWLGYEATMKLRPRYPRVLAVVMKDRNYSATFAVSLYVCTLGAAVWSLTRAGAFGNLRSWLDYNAYVHARWSLFSKLTFFEYVNIYTWLPLTSAFLILSRRKWWPLFPVLGLLAFLQLSLFLKKSLLTSLVMLACAGWVYWFTGSASRKIANPGRMFKSLGVFCIVLYLAHAGLTARLVLSNTSNVFELKQLKDKEGGARQPGAPEPPTQEPRTKAIARFDRRLIPSVNGRSVLLYTLFAPLTRTSVPSIAYAELFPGKVPFYHLDIALDVLGIGQMPDDNRVVNNILWPSQVGGSIAVPFHFVLYSQGGILVALCGSFLVGAILAAIWVPLSSHTRLSSAGSVFAGAILTFAWLISIDSLRNNFLVSYGMVWAVPLLAIIYAGRNLFTGGKIIENDEAALSEKASST